jgi:hypothetical protein
VLTLKRTNQIGGHADLQPVEAWPLAHAIERMRNEMLAS